MYRIKLIIPYRGCSVVNERKSPIGVFCFFVSIQNLHAGVFCSFVSIQKSPIGVFCFFVSIRNLHAGVFCFFVSIRNLPEVCQRHVVDKRSSLDNNYGRIINTSHPHSGILRCYLRITYPKIPWLLNCSRRTSG
jgi:hypothetical protein